MPQSLRNQELGFNQSLAFVIGINRYPHIDSNLRTAVSDAEEIAKRLKVLQGFDHVLLMKEAGKAQIEHLLDWLGDPDRGVTFSMTNETFNGGSSTYTSSIHWLKSPDEEELKGLKNTQKLTHVTFESAEKEVEINIGKDDSIIFYYAGHGFPGEKNNQPAGFLAPTDTRSVGGTNNDSLIPMDEVYTALNKSACKHTLLILDCCYAGGFRHASLTRGRPKPFIMPMHKRRYERFKKGKAWQVLVSAGQAEKANDSASHRGIYDHSPFAKTFMDALEGEADTHVFGNKTQGDGIITAHELYLYVWNKVEAITSERKPQHPALFPMEDHDKGEFIFLNPNVSIDQFKFAKDPDKNPYKGLLSYEPEDANLFFGREKAVDELREKIRSLHSIGKTPLIFVSAPSAAGKSSLIKAGLFPTLQKIQQYEEMLIFRPANINQIIGETISSIEKKVEREGSKGQLEKITITGEYQREKWTGWEEFSKRLDSTKKQVVLIDQFEEFFTELSEEEQNDFEAKMLEIFNRERQDGAQPWVVLFTIRSDVEWQIGDKKMGEQFWQREHIYRLQPMDLDELRQALTGPAWWALYDFKDVEDKKTHSDNGEELINEILSDVAPYPASLPLLSSMMHIFYEKAKEKNKKQLSLAAYQSLGGIEGALSEAAESFFQKLSPEKQALMQQLFLRMIHLSDGGYKSRKVTYAEAISREEQETNNSLSEIKTTLFELEFGDRIGDILKELVDELEKVNLIIQSKTPDGIPTIEPAHDALINNWPRCLSWIGTFGKENLTLQRQLWQAVVEFASHAPSKQAKDTVEVSKAQIPYLWDSNPRLQQAFFSIIDPKDELKKEENIDKREGATYLWNDDLEKPEKQEKVANLLSWLQTNKVIIETPIDHSTTPEHVLSHIFSSKKSWLNEQEAQFVLQSWKKKNEWIKQLKNERDQALATALAAKAAIKQFEDPTIAYNMAYEALKMNKSIETKNVFNGILSNNHEYYKQTYTGHASIINAVAFSPDGKYTLTGGEDKTIKLWERSSGKEIKAFSGHSDSVLSAVFSPDGQYILTGSADHTAKLWNISSGEVIKTFLGHSDTITSAVFSSNGEYILTGSKDKTAKLWKYSSEEAMRTFSAHTEAINSVAFSPNGRYLLTGSEDQTAKLWKFNSEKVISTFSGHIFPVSSVAFSPDGKFFLTGSSDKTVKLWDLTAEEEISIFSGHDAPIYSATFSPSGRYILTGSEDQTAKLWDRLSGGEVCTFSGHDAGVRSAVFSADGQYILTGNSYQGAKLWKRTSRKEIRTFSGHTSEVNAVAFSPDGQYALTGSDDKTAKLWEPTSGKEIKTFSGHILPVRSVAFSPDGQYILTGSDDQTVKLWDLNLGTEIRTFSGHISSVFSGTFSPDGKYILTGSIDKTVKLWDINTAEIIKTLSRHNDSIWSVTFSPDGKYILSGSADYTAKLWDIKTGKEIRTFSDHTDYVTAVAFSPGGKYVLTGSWDHTAKLWERDSGRQIRISLKHDSQINTVAFSRDGEYFLTGSGDRTAKLWDLDLRAEIRTLSGHTGAVLAVAFSPDGKYILTGSEDHTTKLWDSISFDDRAYKLTPQELKQYGIHI